MAGPDESGPEPSESPGAGGIYDLFRVAPERPPQRMEAVPMTMTQAPAYEYEEAFKMGDQMAVIRIPVLSDEADLEELEDRFQMILKRLRRKFPKQPALPAPSPGE